MSYPAYSEYKDSGVEWLGCMPKEWDVCKLKFLAELLNGYAFNSDHYVDDGIPIVRIGDVKDSVDWEGVKRVPKNMLPVLKRFLIMYGDILLAMTGATIGKTSVWKYDEEALLNQRVGIIRSNVLCQKYLSYCAKSESFTKHIELECYGGAQENIGKEDIGDIWLAVPTYEEQTQIATFLDRETQKIDRLIEKQQQLIKLLQEKRQAVISHAVTKGLNPTNSSGTNLNAAGGPKGEGMDSPSNAKMKDSGVEWLGEIPGHWGCASLGYYSQISTGATPDRSQQNYWNGDIPWIKTGEVNYSEILDSEERITCEAVANTSVSVSPPGTLLMAMYGQGITRGRVAILGIHAAYNQACAAITPNNRVWNQYLRYFFMAAYHAVRDGGNETSQMNLNADIISKFKITIPKLDEQKDIVDYLDKKLKHFDKLISKSTDAIQLSKERRTALISAAVTGKIDVRHIVNG